MSNSPAPSNASHESGSQDDNQNAHGSKVPASKDKECQYCHQKFTSSSLGRHLDQFIHKKKPDGIHNVEEIRRLRAGITRRTARGGRKSLQPGEQDDGHSQSNNASPIPQPQIVQPSFNDTLNKGLPGTNDVRFNRMNWQATGVITDPATFPATHAANASIASPIGASPTGANASTAGTKRSFSTYAADLNSSTTNETSRALELSLREVLDAVRAATKRAAPALKPFSFDFSAQTFPSLCLALLPTPATLFKPSPFATPNTIPLSPPGPEQYQAVQQQIPLVVDNWKWDALSHAQRNPQPGGTSIADEADNLSRSAQAWIREANTHLDAAYRDYMSYPLEQRVQLWTIELLRAYKTEQDKVKETNERIERITQETNQLQQQIDYLSRCQWPREMALWPPERSAFDSRMQSELRAVNLTTSADTNGGNAEDVANGGASHSTDHGRRDRWDFDKLLNKWKRHVREDRARRTGVSPQVGNPPASAGTVLPSIHEVRNSTEGGSNGHPSQRTANTPSSLRKALPELATNQQSPVMNGHSSANRSVEGLGGGGGTPTDGARSGGGGNPYPNSSRPIAGTPQHPHAPSYTSSPYPNSTSSKPATPQVNVQIISDVHDHMARFVPWFKQQREQELREKAEAAEDESETNTTRSHDPE